MKLSFLGINPFSPVFSFLIETVISSGTKYSRMNQVKFVEDSL